MDTDPHWPQISAINTATAFLKEELRHHRTMSAWESPTEPRHHLTAHKCILKGPSTHRSQPITLSQLHRLCRVAADLFFPMHTDTLRLRQSIQGHKSLTWAVWVPRHQRSCCGKHWGSRAVMSLPGLQALHSHLQILVQSPETLHYWDSDSIASDVKLLQGSPSRSIT